MTWRVGGVASDDSGDGSIISDEGFINRIPSDSFENTQNITATPMLSTNSSPSAAVQLFTERIRQLESAVKDGTVDVPEGKGGIWVNGLETIKKPVSTISPINRDDRIEVNAEVIEGYEERIAELIASGQITTEGEDVNAHHVDDSHDTTKILDDFHLSLLSNHRGYQAKQLENIQKELRKKVSDDASHSSLLSA